MPSFHENRQLLKQARTQRENLRQQLFRARQRAQRMELRISNLKRSFDSKDPAQAKRVAALQSQLSSQKGVIAKLNKAYLSANSQDLKATLDFANFSDPRQQIEELDDRFPILMMPLRIETRFKTLFDGKDPYSQLWVRVFPDDWAIDNFEEELSETELKNTQLYWMNHWKAGGFEEEQRAAWRALVANHGTGRAAYLISRYLPNNPTDEAKKTNRQDVALIISVESLPNTILQQRVSDFWTAIWHAETDQAAADLAWNSLIGQVGVTEAERIRLSLVPANLTDEPLAPFQRDEVQVTVHFIQFPSLEAWEAKVASWSQAASAQVLPDRLVLRLKSGDSVREILGNPIRTPLQMGPDPSAEPTDQLQKKDGILEVPEGLKWMTDFEEAVNVGLGFRIPLDITEANRGFDQIMVLGVRMSSDEQESQELMEQLIDHHHYSRTDFSLLPQGTPTNNTEGLDSGYSYRDDAEKSFDRYVKVEDQFVETDDWQSKKDGQWLAEWLGIRPEVFKKVAFSGSADQCESRAMNTALWPATLGYTMESMMGEVFGPQTRKLTKSFFSKMVVPRGPIPTIRIGEQPYGIMPATAWSRMTWVNNQVGTDPTRANNTLFPEFSRYLRTLYPLLQKMDDDWEGMQEAVSHVGKRGPDVDAHQMLLDIVGLHPSSVEFHQRYAQSIEQLYNQYNMLGLGGQILAWLIAGSYVQSGMDLLADLGSKVDSPPEILTKLFLQSQNLLKGPLIDDTNILSEHNPIRSYTETDQNYIYWLIEAAGTSLDTLRSQAGFLDNKRPKALLYNMLRHSLQLSYWESSLRLLSEMPNPILSQDELRIARTEPKFIHVEGSKQRSESKFEPLYRTAPALTNDNNLTVAEFIPQIIHSSAATQYLSEQLSALEHLKDTPTARLERVFTEHIDACSYRLDAWKQSLVTYQLSMMRFEKNPDDEDPIVKQGLYLGGYGYLENVRPEHKKLTEVKLPTDLAAVFQGPNDTPLMDDSTNQGYIHAPSLNHAVTAAVLRNGFLSNATEDASETLAVNLSSERVRLAMGVMEGIRNGQSLGALLGYQLERDLHDNHQLAETDSFIFELRKAFPLVANRLKRTKLSGGELDSTSIRAMAARNVVDGVRMADHIQRTGIKTYPFGKSNLPVASASQAQKINAAVDRMLNINDAVADLAIAESVHQTVLGNYDRAAANLDAYSRGGLPPVPDVVQTPRSGVTLSHRVALMLDPDAASKPAPWPAGMTARANAEPAINLWLGSILPAPSDIVVQVHRSDTDSLLNPAITVSDLAIQPIDLLLILKMESEQAMQEMDDLILAEALNRTGSIRATVEISIQYATPEPGKVTLFELAPMMAHLRKLILASRHIQPTDLSLHNEAKDEQDISLSLNRALVDNAITTLQATLPGLDGYIGLLAALLDDPVANRDDLINQIDTHLDDLLQEAKALVPFGMTEASRAFGYDWKKTFFTKMDTQIENRGTEWTARLARFDAFLVAEAAAGTPEKKFQILQQAELEISTAVTTPLPNTPALFRADLLAKRALFDAKRLQLQAILSLSTHQVTSYLNAIRASFPLDSFDWEEFSLLAAEQDILTFSGQLLSRAQSLRSGVQKRINTANDLLATHDATASSVEKVDLIKQAGKVLFGEEFVMIPHFMLEKSHGIELENAYTNRADLLKYQINDQVNPFPVDEWLYGVGRVREKVFHWEQLTMLSEGFGGSDLDLQPLQLPFRANDSWLGLQYPEDYDIDMDRLLLTWLHSTGFSRNSNQCGLLLDEWTEVIPTKEETTGVTFHYDKPNSEPPQVMLLVTPTKFQQSWDWQDVVDAVEESFAMAKQRAVEPEQLNETNYARFLPATISAVTMHPITIAMNYAVVNGLNDVLNPDN